jgi:hypothetical protein
LTSIGTFRLSPFKTNRKVSCCDAAIFCSWYSNVESRWILGWGCEAEFKSASRIIYWTPYIVNILNILNIMNITVVHKIAGLHEIAEQG